MTKLTIGMACYNDYNGVYFSVQSLQMHHSEIMNQSEIIVVDNNPDSPDGKAVKEFLNNWVGNSRYIPYLGTTGTAMPRNVIFEEARGEYVLCMDSHVLVESGAARKLIDFYDSGLDGGNLLQGPMLYDDLKGYASHMDPVWRSEMYGVWGTDDRARSPNSIPFEIEMHGLGLFSCRKSEWLGFNEEFEGFGGEEGYIHEKFRRANKKTLCLPFLRWLHRFGRPRGVEYPLTIEAKLRNYLIGAIELGQDLTPILNHFKPLIPAENVARLLEQFGVTEKI
tara:strand:- start:669 stop:1508 length:840 start_codon:yes stop_codon:yes gene_type:complete